MDALRRLNDLDMITTATPEAPPVQTERKVLPTSPIVAPSASAFPRAGLRARAITLIERPQQWVTASSDAGIVPYWHRWVTYLLVTLVAGMVGLGAMMVIDSINDANAKNIAALEQRVVETMKGWERTKAELAAEKRSPWWKPLLHWW